MLGRDLPTTEFITIQDRECCAEEALGKSHCILYVVL
jgi:hypothetical protein